MLETGGAKSWKAADLVESTPDQDEKKSEEVKSSKSETHQTVQQLKESILKRLSNEIYPDMVKLLELQVTELMVKIEKLSTMQDEVASEHAAAHARYADLIKKHLDTEENRLGPLAGAENDYLDVHAASILRV